MNFENFDWELYVDNYSFLKDKNMNKHKAWKHFKMIGLENNYIYFDITKRNEYNLMFENFDWEVYLSTYEYIRSPNIHEKYSAWWHYCNYGKNEGCSYISVNKSITPKYHIRDLLQQNGKILCNNNDTINDDTISNNDTINNNKITIYYYIDHLISTEHRSGIQILTIYLAKCLYENRDEYKCDIIFVKWDNSCIIPCNSNEIKNIFNDSNIPEIVYSNYNPIHMNDICIFDSVFFCPELTFSRCYSEDFLNKLNNYLTYYQFKTIYILYDIIPLVLDAYHGLCDIFKCYLIKTLLPSSKIICISNFTRDEFLKYCKTNNFYNNDKFPHISSILLPYQFRNTQRVLDNTKIDESKITILLPGTIEPRKQQIMFMKIFNKFTENNPEIDVEIIVYGNIWESCKEEFFNVIEKSNNKIKYLNFISDDSISDLYKKASFLTFISIYEGFGFPIAESLWHGLPVLTSNFGSMAEIAVAPGCYAINSCSKQEIYRALDTLVKNKSVILNLKNNIVNNSLSYWTEYTKCIVNEFIF
jgi:glycosyltransferase involved in cell wall biosynthesis